MPTSTVGAQRILAISALPALEPRPTGATSKRVTTEALQLAYRVGARGTHVAEKWRDLEPSAGQYRLTGLVNTFDFLSRQGFVVQLTLQVVATTTKETPRDLLKLSFNTKKLKERFRALVDALCPYLKPQAVYLSIGNEVDVYLGTHNEWDSYQEFYQDAVAYIHHTVPGLKVGVTCTFGGAVGQWTEEIASLNAVSDVYMLTYYPLKPGFLVQEPAGPLADLPKMVSLTGSRPIVLQEVGYPASPSLGSSEQKQAEFVTNVYRAWQAASTHIPFLNFFVMHDFTPGLYDAFMADYGLADDQDFREFLCSLGLRHANGTPKLSWNAFVDGAVAMD